MNTPRLRLARSCFGRSGLVFLLCASTALFASACGPSEPYARAYAITRLDQAIGGEKAMVRPANPRTGRPADFILENDKIRLGILGAHSSMGPAIFGGSLADADLQYNDSRYSGGRGRDQLAEVFGTANMNVIAPREPGDVSVLSDGSDGGAAIIRVQSAPEPFLAMLKALWGFAGPEALPDYMIQDYILEPGVPWVRMDTSVYYGFDGGADPPEAPPMPAMTSGFPLIQVAVEEGVVGGDFYLQGGSVDVFAPGMGFDEDGEVFAARKEGRNLFLDPFEFEFLAGVGDGLSYGIASAVGPLFVPLFTSSQTATFYQASPTRGGTRGMSYSRYFFVGDGDVGSIVDGYLAALGVPSGSLHGVVLEEGTESPRSGVDVFVYRPGADRPYSQWRTDVDVRDDVADGSFGGDLPVGDWELMVHAEGRPDSARVPITVTEGSDANLTLHSPRPGLLSFTVRDERGELVPAKVTLFRLDGDSHRDPVLGDGFIAGSPEAVLYPAYGRGETELPDGRYQAVASRGLEYELDVSEPFTVSPVTRTHLELQVVRSVVSEGWVSADLHVHALNSHDSGISLADRVRTMVCEGVEFFAATDHDYTTDYAPIIETMNLEEWVQSAPGEEITTIETGHFLGFPLAQDFVGDAGGATDWVGLGAEDLLGSLRQHGRANGLRPVVFVGHPRAGILGYFDQFGFDPYAGTPNNPVISPGLLTATNPLLATSQFSLEFDAIELLSTKDLHFVRTPTQPELDAFAADPTGGDIMDVLTRTLEEQDDLASGAYRLGWGRNGQIDDWFTLLNLGFRYTALGNSDTHGWSSTEAGCPRNYIMSDTDDPAFIDDQEMADAVRDHKVVASYGPFVQMWANGRPIGSDVSAVDGGVDLSFEIQAPSWMDVDRVEIYENGTLVDVLDVPPGVDPLRLVETVHRDVAEDAWFVAIVTGDGDLSPVFTPVEIPYIPLDQVVAEALGGVGSVAQFLSPAVPIPLEYPIHPYAVTNPIWVDADGDGEWTAPGRPSWLLPPVEPAP